MAKLKNSNIALLRTKIIKEITNKPSTEYRLFALTFQDAAKYAAKCYPLSCANQCDLVEFVLDLITEKIYAELSTYPMNDGQYYSKKHIVSVAEFIEKAKQFNLNTECCCIQTEQNLTELFNDDLRVAVVNAQNTITEEENKRLMASKIVLPEKNQKIKPNMELSEVLLYWHRISRHDEIQLIRENDKYILFGNYTYAGSLRVDKLKNKRVLSDAEAVWVEEQIDMCLKTLYLKDDTIDAKMQVVIKKGENICVDMHTQAKKEYCKLQNNLQKLLKYGSVFNSELEQFTR